MTNNLVPHHCFRSAVPSTETEVHNEDDINRIIPSLLGWPVVDNAVEISRIPGGITNRIFKVSLNEKLQQQQGHHQQSVVLVRIFGGIDVFSRDERIVETIIFEQLGRAGISPPLLAKFGNGRVETFLIGSRPITLQEMTTDSVCDGVAMEMARLHLFIPDVPNFSRKPTLWSTLENWAKELERHELYFKQHFQFDISKHTYPLSVMKKTIGHDNDVVFMHGDLLAGNIMQNEHNGNVTLIDYEYSAYGYRAYDIGNFFAEAMGGTQDGHVRPELYPSLQCRKRFCTVYLTELNGYEPTKEQVNALVNKAEQFGLVAHLYWGLWALLQSLRPNVDFPYVQFAKQRFHQFFTKYALEFSS